MGSFTRMLLMLVIMPVISPAAVFSSPQCGAGSGNIPDLGTLTCDISIAGSGVISAGDQIAIALLGLQHEASGDLSVILTHLSSDASTIYGSAAVFERIGKTTGDIFDFGFAAQFGNASGTGDNYRFRSSFTGDLWSTAAVLGAAEFIPGDGAGSSGYWTTALFSSAATNFSSAFAGQTLAGIWRLTITDHADGPTSGSTGSLLQWELTIDNIDETTQIPEPGQAALVMLALVSGAIVRRRIAS